MEVTVAPGGTGGIGGPEEAGETSGTREPPAHPRAGRRRARHRRAVRRTLIGVAVVLAVALTLVTVSLVDALGAPGHDPAGVKIVEWLRGHGAGGLVNDVESWWYTHHQPKVGGRPRHGIPHARAPVAAGGGTTPATVAAVVAAARPPDVAPIASPALPLEGVWQPTGKLVDGRPAVYETFLRPDPFHTSLVTGVVWMDRHSLRGALYNGLQVPGGGPWVHGAHIAAADDASLVAAFNGGFRLDASRGGYFTEGRTVRPLVAGRASLVITRDGTVSVGAWGRDAAMTPDVVSVRQNLDLIVDGGRPVPGLLANDHSRWGATLGGKVYVWRSGVGVDRNGNLIYVGGPGLNITTLANVLARAGSVRAMELDINSEWVSFYTYTGTSAADIRGVKLLGSVQRPADRYLHDGTRDFVALFVR